MKIYIPVATGIEAAAKREIERLGLGHAPAIRGRIELEGGWDTVARLNVFLRAGERVLIGMGEFPAPDFDALYEGVYALPWEEFLSAKSKILLDGKSFKSKLVAIKAAGGVVKKAIVNRLKDKLHILRLTEDGERAVVGVSIFEDVATITLDTSGDGLHKRGYRVLTYDAPLRETTAAAIVEESFYHKEKVFCDPFCGSGTFPIEAALYARNIAPGKSRPFDFTKWKCAPKDVLNAAREEALSGEYHGKLAPIYASDISKRAVSVSTEHAKRAGVLSDICFTVSDMGAFSTVERYGVLAANPPYGERMKGDIEGLYQGLAKMYRRLPDWSAYVITAYEGAERALGKPSKRRILYNANLKCSLLTYYGEKPKTPRNDP